MSGLREVLAGHEGYGWMREVGGWTCRCGKPLTAVGEPARANDAREPWQAHVEAAVLAWVAERLGDRALRDRAVTAAYQHADDNGMADHEEAVEAALSVVRADLSDKQGATAPRTTGTTSGCQGRGWGARDE